jgi:3-deoxy-D-manno-octulosonate 8-phosphate phosphatase (KDO 8-P phosphatase)
MKLSTYEIDTRARRLRLLLFDVDGVLTDGTILLGGDGSEAKRFSIRDGAGIVWARQAGLTVGLLSGRPSEATRRRAAELGITLVSQAGPDKLRAFARVIEDEGVREDEVAYMGDDLLDLGILERVGLSGAPADATPEVIEAAGWVSRHDGGRGAAREFIEVILRARGRWTGIVDGHRT